VLIAGALSAVIVGLSIQQVMGFFRLQSTLVTRTELRHEIELAQERIALKLRYAVMLVQRPEGYIAVLPQDEDNDGWLCNKDRVEVLWWRVKQDPLSGQKTLSEATVTVRAFTPPDDPARLEELFGSTDGKGHLIAPHLSAFSIDPQGQGNYKVRLEAEQPIPQRKEPVKLALSQLVAVRSIPYASGLADFDKVLANLRWRP
jgi:hypothetical protein